LVGSIDFTSEVNITADESCSLMTIRKQRESGRDMDKIKIYPLKSLPLLKYACNPDMGKEEIRKAHTRLYSLDPCN
jgi:hypothetical protein